MGRDNYILAYYQAIKDGTVTVGRWMELVFDYLINGLEEGVFFYNAKKANAAIDWIEKHCFHTQGPKAPSPIKLELWQKAFIASIFGIVDENDLRQHREVFLVEGRKNSKTKLAACIASYIWRLEGGYGARVYCIAPKLEQASLVYDDVWQMVLLDPEYQRMKEELGEKDEHNKKIYDDSMLPRHRQSDLSILGTNSTVKKLAYSARKSDGFSPSLCICDEIASWQGDGSLKQYEVMKSGMGARPEGLMLSCTTSGYQNDNIYDELMKRATRFLLGESKESRLLPFLYMIDDVEKWNDINELRKSNPNLSVSVPVSYLLEEIAIAEGSLSRKAEFICKYACLKQNSSTAWLSTQTVSKCMGEELRLEDYKHNYAVMGIDLSQTRDLTAAVVVIEKDGRLNVFAKFWLPSERIDEAAERDGVPYRIYVERGLLEPSGDNFVDYRDCYNWMLELVEKYEILPLVVGYDRYSAQYLVQDLKSYGFNCDDVFQGDNLWNVMQEAEGMMKDGSVCIGDNDLLKAHFLNSAVKMSTERGRGRLIKCAPNAHVDGMAALLDALAVRQKHYPEIGYRLKNVR